MIEGHRQKSINLRTVQDMEKVCIMTIRKLMVADKIHTSHLTLDEPLTKTWVTRKKVTDQKIEIP